jgi:enterochelin esterase family protein
MITSIIPFIEDNYKVYTDQSHRAMAGLSMGGMETLEVTLNHPEMFSYVWVLSSSFAPGNKEVYEFERGRLKREAARYNKNFKELVFTQGGPSDIAYNNCKETLELFKAAGIKYEYHEVPGGHSWTAWRQNLYDLAQRLFK